MSEAQDADGAYEGGEMNVEDQPKKKSSKKREERKGHLLCGMFCDMRIAVVFIDVANILLLVIGGAISTFKYGWGGVGAHFPGIVLSGIGIFGAMNFQAWAVAMTTIGYTIGFLMDVWWLNFIGIIIGALAIYPHAVLTHEIYTGIMSKETYKREEFVMV